jgi:hypothetical protein
MLLGAMWRTGRSLRISRISRISRIRPTANPAPERLPRPRRG